MALACVATVASSWSTRLAPAACAGALRPLGAPRRARAAHQLASRSKVEARLAGVAAGRSGARSFSDFISLDSPQGGEERQLRLAFATSCLPHPEKAHKGGEDSYFASPTRRAFGVADGVGGYAENGVDPGEFARRLLRYAFETITSEGTADGEADLHKALLDAARQLHETRLQGGSTALLGQLNGDRMAILNLGDSGAMVLRPALRTPPGSDQPLLFPRVVFRSSDQTHYFNCPYQLGSGNAPLEAPDLIHVRVRPGDLLIAATDGVFDNLFDHQVQALVARHLGTAWRSGSPLEPLLPELATRIVRQAQRIGAQEDKKDVITPFALAAHSEGLPFRGGKLDDTTVVVGLVTSSDSDEVLADGELPYLNNFVRD